MKKPFSPIVSKIASFASEPPILDIDQHPGKVAVTGTLSIEYGVHIPSFGAKYSMMMDMLPAVAVFPVPATQTPQISNPPCNPVGVVDPPVRVGTAVAARVTNIFAPVNTAWMLVAATRLVPVVFVPSDSVSDVVELNAV
jgi:hypothetical protein